MNSIGPDLFFSEPASLAVALLPLLYYSLKNKEYRWAGFTTASIFATTSTVGVILAAILWLVLFVLDASNWKVKIIFVIACFFAVCYLMRLEYMQDAIQTLGYKLKGQGSAQTRITLGVELIKQLHLSSYPIGELYNRPFEYVIKYLSEFPKNSVTVWVAGIGEDLYFLNGLADIIFRYGLVGIILFFMTYKGKIFNCDKVIRAFSLMMIVQAMGSSIAFNSLYFFETLILFYNYVAMKNDIIVKEYGYQHIKNVKRYNLQVR